MICNKIVNVSCFDGILLIVDNLLLNIFYNIVLYFNIVLLYLY